MARARASTRVRHPKGRGRQGKSTPPGSAAGPPGPEPPCRPPAAVGGRRQGTRPPPSPPPLPPPLPSPWADGGRPERRSPCTPRGGRCTRGGDTTAAASAAARQAPPVDRPLTPALPAADRQRNGGTQECANEAAQSGASLEEAGERTGARRPLPPPPATLTLRRPT